MEKIKLSKLKKEMIINAKKRNEEYIVQLRDGNWYLLEIDYVQLEAGGGELMDYIISLATGSEK